MGDITIFELHFDGGLQLGPSFGDEPSPDVEATDGGEPRTDDDTGDGDDDARDDETTVDVDVEESGTPVRGAILGVLALVALAVAARVLLSGDDDDVDDVEIVDLDEDAADE